MKEVTYGWYPSANDVYRSKGRPATSHLQCLYKYQDSMYYQGQVAPPQPELMVMGVSTGTTPTPDELRCLRSKTVPVPKFKPIPKLHIPTPTECWNKSTTTHKGVAETSWGIVGEAPTASTTPSVNWPLPVKNQQQQQQQQILQPQLTPLQQQQLLKKQLQNQRLKYLRDSRQLSPQYAWGLKKSQAVHDSPRPLSPSSAELKWPTARKIVSAQPQTSSSSQRSPSPPRHQKSRLVSSPITNSNRNQTNSKQMIPAPPCGRNVTENKRPTRIQSATVHREKTPLPARPLTASPRKEESLYQHLGSDTKELISAPGTTHPVVPVPFIHDVNDASLCNGHSVADRVKQRDESFDEDEYEEILKKYGWRAEVHGDPYKLKRPLPRMSYAVTCPEPGVPPEPPSIHMETNEPFFQNTIPHKPFTFDVDKEWMSEVILAKRLQLQKRDGGIKYSYKNFSFVY